jgi:hypothetical protein
MLDMVVSGYNITVHSGTGIAPALVNDKDMLRKWEKKKKRQAKIRKVKSPPIYSVGQTVRISKEKMQFAKGSSRTGRSKYLEYRKSCAGHLATCTN